jgi:hypothetical protein
MRRSIKAVTWGMLGLALIAGPAIVWRTDFAVDRVHAAAGAEATSRGALTEVKELRAEIERLKDLVPDQAHAMTDAAYHFSNLWFAARDQNWPLADFYLGETLSHLKWAVRLKPIRKDSAGREIKLASILEAMENGPVARIKKAIREKKPAEFEAAYRFALENCYACHKTSDKPYLRPQIPTHAESQMINDDPHAHWPL